MFHAVPLNVAAQRPINEYVNLGHCDGAAATMDL
jgi:hypothetical protein